jgi:alpha-mannosidase
VSRAAGRDTGRVLHMIGHAHLDPVWLWPWQEGYAEARATFRSAIDRMDEYPGFVFTADQVVLLEWVEEQDPELFEQIRARVADGRWQVAGGWWVEPDCNLPSGESLARQGLYGQRYLRRAFGVTATVGMNADPFGHCATLPQILRGQGLDSYVFLRPAAHEAGLPASLFRWRSPDGSEVLAYRIPHRYWSPDGEVTSQIDDSLADVSTGAREVMVFYGVGNHGGGPTRANIDSILRLGAAGTHGSVLMSSPRQFFDAVAAEDLPTWRGELQHHARGCYSAHSGIKAWLQRAETALLAAERWAAVAALADGMPYPREELARAWKQVLFNQFHDVLPGSAIESAYDDARDQLGEAISIGKRAIAAAHGRLARRVAVPHEPGSQPVLVFNPHPWPVACALDLNYPREGDGAHLVDDSGASVPQQPIQPASVTQGDAARDAIVFEAAVPALGYRLYRLRRGRPAAAGAAPPDAAPSPGPGGIRMENERLIVEIDRETGWLARLVDKRTGVDLAGVGVCHAQVAADASDAWGHGVTSYAAGGEPMRVTSVRLVAAGPVRSVVRVERSFGRSRLTEDIILGRDGDAVEVHADLDWRERLRLLKLRFPVALAGPRATHEVPYGAVGRPVDGSEQPTLTWVDVSGTADAGRPAGLALIVAAKHGTDVLPGGPAGESPSIGLTAVRSPAYAWHEPAELRPGADYAYQDQGRQRFRYLLVPHPGDWREAALALRSAELLCGPRVMLEGSHGGDLPARWSFLRCDSAAVAVTAVKGSEDAPATGGADLVIRAVETFGRHSRARFDMPLLGREIVADFAPYQIRTFRVPAGGGQVEEVDLVEWRIGELPGRAV